MITHPIADMLIRIKNGQMARLDRVTVPYSKMKAAVAAVLSQNGFIKDVERRTRKTKKSEFDYLDVGLNYTEGEGVINGMKIISKPSRHLYQKSSEIRVVRSGHGISVLTTPEGVMTSQDARKKHVGGELLFEMW